MTLAVSFKPTWAFFWWALRTLNFLGFYTYYNKEAKSLSLRRGSEVSQATSCLAVLANEVCRLVSELVWEDDDVDGV